MTGVPGIPGDSREPEWTGTEPLIGWRVWNLRDFRGRPILGPAAVPALTFWPPRRPFRATCQARHHARPDHEAPHVPCRCGIYASDSLASLLAGGRSRVAPVIGQVALWGRVVEHRSGWRAASAYPTRLRLVCGACLHDHGGVGAPAIAWRYPGSHLGAACADHARGAGVDRYTFRDPDRLQATLLSTYAVDLLPTEPLRALFSFEAAPADGPTAPWWANDDVTSRILGGERPDDAATDAASPPPAPAPSPTTPPQRAAASVPPVTTTPSVAWLRRALGLAGRVAARLGQAAFAVVFLWVGCADAFTLVEIPAAPTEVGSGAPAPIDDVLDGLPGGTTVPEGGAWGVRDPEAADGDRVEDGERPGRRPSRLAIACGVGHGTWVELVRCGSPRSDLLGFATRPAERVCRPPADAFTRRARFSVCWLALPGVDVHLVASPSSASPFRRDVA